MLLLHFTQMRLLTFNRLTLLHPPALRSGALQSATRPRRARWAATTGYRRASRSARRSTTMASSSPWCSAPPPSLR